ncbi:hypothetical protein AB3S75_007755 [Citrus x aurantiifolia]
MLAVDGREDEHVPFEMEKLADDEHVPVETEKLADSSSTVNTGATEKAMAHEDENEHVPIDMKKLADSLSGKLETLPPLSGKCSIYRMPEPRRCLNPSQYTPQMVSIGPFHYGKEELKAMEEHKQRCNSIDW